MADGDVFTRSMDRRWRRSARQVFGVEMSERAVQSVSREAARCLRDHGCPGLANLAEVATRYGETKGTCPSDWQVDHWLAEIRKVESRYPDAITGIAAKVLRRMVISGRHGAPLADKVNESALAKHLVIDCVCAEICPAILNFELLNNEGWSEAQMRERINELRIRMLSDAGVTRVANQLLKDPTGAGIRVPRYPKSQATQEQLLVTAL